MLGDSFNCEILFGNKDFSTIKYFGWQVSEFVSSILSLSNIDYLRFYLLKFTKIKS